MPVRSGMRDVPPAHPLSTAGDIASGQPDLLAVQARTFRGAAGMVIREAGVKLLAFVGWIVLARQLEPATLGWFAVASFSINALSQFSELGLGASLLRNPGEVPRRQLNAVFTLQLFCSVALAGILALAASPLAGDSVPGAEWVLYALAAALVLVTLRTAPSLVAQRRLEFGAPVLADAGGQVVFWLAAMSGALAGLGIWSIVWAVLASSVAGTAIIYARTGWRPSLDFGFSSIRGSLPFGLMYQGQLAAGFAKYMVLPALGGIFYGPAAVGYVTWAFQLAVVPQQLSQIVARVTYPAFSLVSHDPAALSGIVRSALLWTARLSLPAFAVLAGLAPQIVEIVYGPRWLPALPSLNLFLLNTALSAAVGLLVPAIYSLGNAGQALRLSVGWTALTWLAAALLALTGAGSESLAGAFVVSTAVTLGVTLAATRRLGIALPLRLIAYPVLTGLAVTLVLYYIAPLLVRDLWTLVLLALAGAVTGLALNLWSGRRTVFSALKGLGPL